MAETVGVSKSAVSRRVIEASEAEVEALLVARFDELKLLIDLHRWGCLRRLHDDRRGGRG